MANTSTRHHTPTLAICILFFEKAEQTIECIQSFLPSTIPIIVCNNGSSAESRQALLDFIRLYSHVQYLENSKNLGVSGGRNVLIRSTKVEWLFFVDNDITIQTPQWVEKFQKHLLRLPDTEVFIPQLYNVLERTYSPRYGIEIIDDRLSFSKRMPGNEVNMFPGGASLVRRTLFDRIGAYDESMFVDYEDYELCLRGVVSGSPVKAYKINDVVLRHDHRRAASESDRAYVDIRYDHSRTQSSTHRIFKKYHLRIQSDSSSWSKTQKHKLLRGRKWWSKETLFFLIPASIKKIWNERK